MFGLIFVGAHLELLPCNVPSSVERVRLLYCQQSLSWPRNVYIKTQNFGRVDTDPMLPSVFPDTLTCPSRLNRFLDENEEFFFTFLIGPLRIYRKNRENGEPIDNAKRPFPTSGFDELGVYCSRFQRSINRPDPSGRYWLELFLYNGQVVNDFYWMQDKVRGWPDNKGRCWLTVHHANGTKIEGFSLESYYGKDYRYHDVYGHRLGYVQFTDAHCPAIAQWMEEKDRNYQIRRMRPLFRILYQPPRVQGGFNLFTALPIELQLIILQFVKGRKLALDLLTHVINAVMPKKAISQKVTISKEAEKEEEISHLSLNSDVIEQRGLNLGCENIQFVEKLGESALGIVSYGQWRCEDVAVKQLRIQQLSKNALMEFKQETAIMACLHSDYIVTLKGFCLTPYALVMEYMQGGSLSNVLHSQTILPWSIRHSIALDIAKGLAFLHSHQPERIVHRNLKSQNVLLDAHHRAKLVDFGFAKVRAESSESNYHVESSDKNVGSTPWMAPECFDIDSKYSDKSDMYAYGVVLWEIVSRTVPYKYVNSADEIRIAVKTGKREAIPDETTNPTEPVPASVKKFIRLCWFQAPGKRPTAKKAIKKLERSSQQSQLFASEGSSSSGLPSVNNSNVS